MQEGKLVDKGVWNPAGDGTKYAPPSGAQAVRSETLVTIWCHHTGKTSNTAVRAKSKDLKTERSVLRGNTEMHSSRTRGWSASKLKGELVHPTKLAVK